VDEPSAPNEQNEQQEKKPFFWDFDWDQFYRNRGGAKELLHRLHQEGELDDFLEKLNTAVFFESETFSIKPGDSFEFNNGLSIMSPTFRRFFHIQALDRINELAHEVVQDGSEGVEPGEEEDGYGDGFFTDEDPNENS
jgi:hypothetical protein